MGANHAGVAAILMWSCMTLLISLSAHVPSLQALTISWFVGGALVLVSALWNGENIFAHCKRPLSDYLFVGVGVGVYTAMIFAALRLAPPFEAHVLNYLWPVFLMIFLSIFHKSPMGMAKIVGVLMSFGGCVLLFAHRDGGASYGGIQSGHVLAVAAAVLWALYSCFAKGRDYPYVFMVPIFLICGIVCLVLHLLFETWVQPDLKSWIFLIVLGVLRMAYVLWDVAMRKGDQMLLGSMAYFVPLLATLWMILFGFGASGPMVLAAGALIVAGCLVINVGQISAALQRLGAHMFQK